MKQFLCLEPCTLNMKEPVSYPLVYKLNFLTCRRKCLQQVVPFFWHLNNPIDQNTSRKADKASDSLKIIRIYKRLPHVPIQNKINPVHDYTFHILKIHINNISPYQLNTAKWCLSRSYFTNTLHTPILSPIRATCHAHLILKNVINRKIMMRGKIQSSSLYELLHTLGTSSEIPPFDA